MYASKGSRPSPALLVAVLALAMAMVGTAVAGTDGLTDKITKSKVKKIAKKQINKAAPGLSVANAVTAGTAAPSGPAGGDLSGTYPNPLIGPAKVTTPKIADNAVTTPKIADNAVNTPKIADDTINAAKIAANAVGSSEIAANAVGAAEIADDSVGSAEIAPNVVGADELDTVHEHFSASNTITDTTAHDGAYGFDTATVICGVGEDLLSVSIDWTDDNGHNETVFGGVDTISRVGDDSATVRVAFDGGGGAGNPAAYQAVATCIF